MPSVAPNFSSTTRDQAVGSSSTIPMAEKDTTNDTTLIGPSNDTSLLPSLAAGSAASTRTRYPVHPSSSFADEEVTGDESIGLKEQDLLLPIANVSRIMKQAVPTNAKISKEAKDTVKLCSHLSILL